MKKHPQLFTMKEAAEQLGYSYSHMYHLAEHGDIRVIKGYGRWLVHRKEIEKWVREHRVTGAPPLPPEERGQIPGQIEISQEDLKTLMESRLYRVTFADEGKQEKHRYFHCKSAREAARKMRNTRPGCEVLEVDLWAEDRLQRDMPPAVKMKGVDWDDGETGDRKTGGGDAWCVPENCIPAAGAGDTENSSGDKTHRKKLDRRLAKRAVERGEDREDDQ